jgi:hypothetical protein
MVSRPRAERWTQKEVIICQSRVPLESRPGSAPAAAKWRTSELYSTRVRPPTWGDRLSSRSFRGDLCCPIRPFKAAGQAGRGDCDKAGSAGLIFRPFAWLRPCPGTRRVERIFCCRCARLEKRRSVPSETTYSCEARVLHQPPEACAASARVIVPSISLPS